MADRNEILLDLRCVSRAFTVDRDELRTVIDDISLGVPRGQIVVLLGPSGCGKSTVLRIVAGLLQPTRGEVLFDGAPVVGPSSDRCMVFQNYSCFTFLTAEDNIAFGLSLKGLGKKEIKIRTHELLQEMGLEHLRDAYPASLSGGERQRVAIARSLAVHPRLLLMDEPFSSLDGLMRRRLQDLLLGLSAREGLTCLFVTHSVEEAVYLGSQVYVMSAGPTEHRHSPATVIGQIKVEFSRPRTQGIKAETEFGDIERHVNELLRTKAYEPV
jgi:NitT/TauT family transport system ATP-binding protein